MSRQNVYDDPDFFRGYAQLRRSEAGLNEALEQPALFSLLPPVAGTGVDLGCGAGDLCRYLATHGAATVVGVDPSERMLRLAKEQNNPPNVSFRHAFAEDVAFEPESLDLVVSSLMFHYVQDLAGLLTSISRWLRPGGTLVTTMEHPVMTAAPHASREPHFILASYADEGVRDTSWFVDGVRKHHRTVATVINSVLDAGLRIERLLEPAPPVASVHRARPPLLALRAGKPF